MDEQELATQLLPLAKLTARKYLRDVEAESIAGWALLRAIRSYDGVRSLDGYVMYCVKVDCWHYLRKCKVRASVELRDNEFLKSTASYDDPYTDDVLTPLQWKMLAERYELRWPFDVVAHRNGMSTHKCKRCIATAIAKLEAVL